MSFISGAINFLASPIKDLACAQQGVAEKLLDGEVKLVNEEKENLLRNFTHVLPSEVEDKIKIFIKERLGYENVDNIYLRIDDARTGGKICHSLSTKVHGFCMLFFSKNVVEEIEQNFTEGHQFFLAHEMAHDEMEDKNFFIKQQTSSSKFKLGSYLVSMVTLNSLLGTSCWGICAGHVASVGISKYLDRILNFRAQRKIEKECDLRAVTDRPELAQAGIKEFEKIRELRLELRSTNPAGSHFINEKGELTTDLKHPTIQERIEYLGATLTA